MFFSAYKTTRMDSGRSEQTRQMMLWIDGVGAFLICEAHSVTIGGPKFDSKAADVCLLANLSRRHASILRRGEQYFVVPHSETRLAGRAIYETAPLNSGYEIGLGESVELGFRLPTALSSTAVLDFRSDHRPAQTVDGIILMKDNCLMGPGRDNHIQCPAWPDSIVLFRRGKELMCKTRMEIVVDGSLIDGVASVALGSVIKGDDLCFRIEDI